MKKILVQARPVLIDEFSISQNEECQKSIPEQAVGLEKILRVNGLYIDLGIAMRPLLEMLLKTKSVIENTLTMIL